MCLRTGIALFLAVAAAVVAAPAHAAPVVREVSLEQGLLVEVNALRKRHGLRPLRRSAPLAVAAARHSRAMAARGFFAHASHDGSAFWKRLQRTYPARGLGRWAVGENLAWATELDPARTVEMWLASPPHRRVLLDPRWREAGFGAVRAVAAPGAFGGHDVTIVTADFGVRR